jgi:hypothetical protein
MNLRFDPRCVSRQPLPVALSGRSAPPHGSPAWRAGRGTPREKAGGRYAVGFFLRLPARFPVPSRLSADCNGVVNERLKAA